MLPVADESRQRQQQGGPGGRKKGMGNPALQRIAWRKWLSHPGVPGGTLFGKSVGI